MFYVCAEPSNPRNVTIADRELTSASAKIVWTTPAAPNGAIAYYTVSYVIGHYSTSLGHLDVKTLNVSKLVHITLTNLNPYTIYTIWVQAINVEGGHHLVSNASAVKTFRTLADGKGVLT